MKIFILPLSLCLAACAGMQDIDRQANERGLPADYFNSQEECFTAWRGVIGEWISNGGEISGNLDKTRRFIQNDNKSRLSILFKRVWKQQLVRHGNGPLSKQELSELFTSAINTEVPEACGSVAWIQDMFTTADGVISYTNKNGLLESAPVSAQADDRSLSRWIIYTLLKYAKPE